MKTLCTAGRGRAATCFAIIGIAAFSASGAFAGTYVFDFEAESGLGTPFSSTNNGVQATFSSPSDPSAFEVLSLPPLFVNLSGNALFQLSDPTLNIVFDQDIQSLTLAFGTTEAAQVALTAFDASSAQVGSPVTVDSAVLPSGLLPEGQLSFGGHKFRSVQLSLNVNLNPNATFVIDNLTGETAVPEPGTWYLALVGGLLLGFQHRRRARREVV